MEHFGWCIWPQQHEDCCNIDIIKQLWKSLQIPPIRGQLTVFPKIDVSHRQKGHCNVRCVWSSAPGIAYGIVVSGSESLPGPPVAWSSIKWH
ncbi:hypothetical protein CEXT_210531 [Caerostris extrusa]|uniref:Uncharacterized protein n=1 Tax=Caerostris extrusa TaxID=172846 RepID=A0AAV4UP11_CAEEX|nr:hypothetical protein CEXT_210531 [Caerostris extrusa]